MYPTSADLTVRSFHEGDLPGIVTLLRDHIRREPDAGLLSSWTAAFPAAVLVHGSRVMGFACSTRFAPDVLELTNLLISPDLRNHGWGALVLTHFEGVARECYLGVIAVNSSGYDGPADKRSATAFYERSGYSVIARTNWTNVLYKDLASS